MDPELQPIGWAMEEEMEDPGEEVPSCSWGGGGFFLIISSFSYLADDVFF